MYDLGIINGKVYLPNGFVKTNIYIHEEKIVFISPDLLPVRKLIDARNQEVLPGIIDPHVHFELDLGTIESKDGFKSGSVSAIYGGVTSIIDFLEPVSHASELIQAYEKRMKQAQSSHVDFHFHATIKDPQGDLESFFIIMKQLGLNTLKLFTTYSESGRRTYDAQIIELLKLAKKYDVLILAHIENDDMIEQGAHMTFKDLPQSRQTIAETSEALKLAQFVKDTKSKLYMVHLSSGHTLKALKKHYQELLNESFIIESCPQYFTFSSDLLKQDDGYLYTCAPPLRSHIEVNLLKELIEDVFCIGTDHCAFNKRDKMKEHLADIPLGIGSIEHSFEIMRMHFGEKIIPKMTSNVAKMHQIKNKGSIQLGFDADIFIYRPGLSTVDHHHGNTDYDLYQKMAVPGKITMTILRGHIIKDNKKVFPIKGNPLIKGV